MKTKLLAILATAAVSALLAQGPLTPPGAPAPTMKTLDQIEPRKAINSSNTPGDATNTFIINASGSYYLTGNITGASGKHGISIQADDVTLDLNGFALIGGGGGSFRGINVPAQRKNLAVRNGTVRGWTGAGVQMESAIGSSAEKLRLSDNTGAVGLFAGNGALVKDCVANSNHIGFQSSDRAQIVNCVSTINTDAGFYLRDYAMIVDCTASRNDGIGIRVGGSSTVGRCSATRNDAGITAGEACTITDSSTGNNVTHGIYAVNSNISNCTAAYNAASGMDVAGSSVSNCNTNHNGGTGIFTGFLPNPTGIVNNCRSSFNGGFGILAREGSVTNCAANNNGGDGIDAFNGVVAYCKAANNNQANNGSVDIDAVGATRTGNNPTP